MKRQQVSNPDLALLRLDSPDNLMIITVVMILDTALPVERLKAAITRSLLRIDRLHQRVVIPPQRWQKPYWEQDPAFDLDAHILRIQTPMPDDHLLLEDLIGKLMSVGLDSHRPLWQFFLVEHFGQGSVVVARFHHGIADGMALLSVLFLLTDKSPDAVHQALPAGETTASEEEASKHKGIGRYARRIVHAGARAAIDWEYALDLTRMGKDVVSAMSKLVLTAPDPYPFFRGQLGIQKCAAWSEPIPLEDVKRIGQALGCTVNDVLITVLAGALRRYLELRCESIDKAAMHGFIPVNLRTGGAHHQMGNQFGVVLVELPIGICDPLERIKLVKRRMDDLKASREAVAYLGLLNVMGALPYPIQDAAVNFFDSKGTAIVTNVAGPRQQLYVEGAPINTMMAWVPQSGRVGLGISIISYNGQVRVGVAADKGLMPDPAWLSDCFVSEFEIFKQTVFPGSRELDESIQKVMDDLDQAIQSVDELLQDKKGGSNPG